MNQTIRHLLRQNLAITYLIAGLIMLGGCASSKLPQSHSYLLRSSASTPAADNHHAPARVSIGQISVPAYLQRDELLVLISPREVRPARQHRWAEPLQQGIGRYLRDRLEASLATDSSKAQSPLRVDIHIDELLGTLDGKITLKARYRVSDSATRNSTATEHRIESQFAQQEDGYDGLVSGYETALDNLAESIAKTVKAQTN